MQNVKPKWLRNCVYSTLLIDVLLVAGYFYLDYINAGQGRTDFWGITPLVLIVIGATMTLSAVAGWLFIKRYHARSHETVTLTNLLEEEHFESNIILESITDGVVVVDAQGTTKIVNLSAARMFGWTKEEATGIPYTALYEPVRKVNEQHTGVADEPARQKDDIILSTLKESKPHQKVIQTQTKNNKRFFVDILASPIFKENADEDDQPQSKELVGAIVVFRDVDKQKREEQQRTEFISTASHEMRTPVAAIEGYLSLALNDKVCLVDEKAKGYLEKAHSSTEHLGQLFQDLLTSAKADDGRLASHPQTLEIGEFLEQTTEDLKFRAEEKGLAMEFVMGTESANVSTQLHNNKVIRPLYYVSADPVQLREVVTNLFDNAVKYTPTGKISIGLTGDDNVVQFYIKDTGSGIPPEDVPHLFQKFYRLDNTATRTIGGTGLGLFICRKIIELCNGRIWVDSKLGQGSTFFVNLPRIDTKKAQTYQVPSADKLPEAI